MRRPHIRQPSTISVPLVLISLTLFVRTATAPPASTAPVRISRTPNSTTQPFAIKKPPQIREADAMEWTAPKTPPALESGLNDQEYAQHLADANKRIDPKAIEPDAPFFGVPITQVHPNTPAEALGIKAGDIVLQLDAGIVASGLDFSNKRTAQPQKMLLWTPSQKPREVTIEPGPIGVQMGDTWWVVVSSYIHSLPPGEKPNPDLVAAAVSFHVDTVFTETALFRARQAGSKSPWIEALAALCAMSDLRLEDALSYGIYAMKHGPLEARLCLAPLMHHAALASFRLKTALELETQFEYLKPPANTDYVGALEKTIHDYDALPKNSSANPIYAIEELPVRDVTTSMESLMPDAEEYGSGSKEAAASFRKNRRNSFSLPTGHYHLYVQGPTGSNVEFSARCHFKDTDQNKSEFWRCIKIGLTEKGQKEMQVCLIITTDGLLEASGVRVPPCRLDVKPLVKGDFNLRIAAVGNRCELSVNGISVYYAPILLDEHTRELDLVLQEIGVTGEWRDVSWRTAPARDDKK